MYNVCRKGSVLSVVSILIDAKGMINVVHIRLAVVYCHQAKQIPDCHVGV